MAIYSQLDLAPHKEISQNTAPQEGARLINPHDAVQPETQKHVLTSMLLIAECTVCCSAMQGMLSMICYVCKRCVPLSFRRLPHVCCPRPLCWCSHLAQACRGRECFPQPRPHRRRPPTCQISAQPEQGRERASHSSVQQLVLVLPVGQAPWRAPAKYIHFRVWHLIIRPWPVIRGKM